MELSDFSNRSRTEKEAWEYKKREYDEGKEAHVFRSGWCWAFAIAYQCRYPKLRMCQPGLTKGETGHVYCTDGVKAFDSENLAGIPVAEMQKIYCGFDTPGEGMLLTKDDVRQRFYKNYPQEKWEETIALADTWLERLR